MLSNTSTSTHSIYHVLRHSTTYTLVILAIYYWGHLIVTYLYLPITSTLYLLLLLYTIYPITPLPILGTSLLILVGCLLSILYGVGLSSLSLSYGYLVLGTMLLISTPHLVLDYVLYTPLLS